MKPDEVLEALLSGALDREGALEALQSQSTEDLGFARLDMDRSRRRGIPEVIYGPGKTPAQLRSIFQALARSHPNVLATRVAPEATPDVLRDFPEAKFDPVSRVLSLHREQKDLGVGKILVVCAGTSDLPVAREAELCAQVMGNQVNLLADVGVAGVHRVLGKVSQLREARVLIVVAGMEGALPTVVAGLVDRPVLAVPTSTGYGASFGGIAALLGMLNSCAGGVSVVNIDNGFGAAFSATLMNRS
jgi:NCAIR mutase (PurE)-related protein